MDFPRPTPPHLEKCVDYINNTTLVPLPIESFDDDHEPAGLLLRLQMERYNLIQIREDGIYLRPDLVRK